MNGDFETGNFNGWTVTNAMSGSNLQVLPVPPAHGTLGAAFAATGMDFDSISQTFATTPGALYNFSFFYQPVNVAQVLSNGFRALVNNTVFYQNFDSNSGFISPSGPFVAIGAMTTIEFQGRNAAGVGYLDDVTVTAVTNGVPETGANVLLLSVALVALAGMRRALA